MESNDSREPPRVLPPLEPDEYAPRSSSHSIRESREWLERVLGSESYGAPRVFDLFTLLAITLAFAMLMASLRLLQPLLLGELETLTTAIGLFVAGIAVFQMALLGGNNPRLASLLAGPVLLFVLTVSFSAGQPAKLLDPKLYVAALCSSVFLGLPAGYLGGAMVAGVFLIADFFRCRYLRQPERSGHVNDDDIFAEESFGGESSSSNPPDKARET
jgi:hypothetical protein